MNILRRLLYRLSERLYRFCHPNLLGKSPAELIDLLITADIKCFFAQECLMKKCEYENPDVVYEVARRAQELNAKRNKIMLGLDEVLGFPNYLTKKTYE